MTLDLTEYGDVTLPELEGIFRRCGELWKDLPEKIAMHDQQIVDLMAELRLAPPRGWSAIQMGGSLHSVRLLGMSVHNVDTWGLV